MRKYYLLYSSLILVVGIIFGGTLNVCAQQIKAKEKMKFLVISEPKDIYYSMSQSERKKIDDSGDVYFKKAVKSGQILEVYAVPGWNRYVTIEEYENIEELYNHFNNDPSYPFGKYEIYPLKKDELTTEGAGKNKSNTKMKFLVISEKKDIFYLMSATDRKKIEDANTVYFNNEVKAGAFLEAYAMPGWNRYVTIEQYESIEDLYKHFEGDPIYPYQKFEVYPLKKEVYE
jgi:quinol monooxygenase YgiN